jgi:hypothetical protein
MDLKVFMVVLLLMGTNKPADSGGRESARGEPGMARSGVVRVDAAWVKV